MTPGQLGPMRRLLRPDMKRLTLIMSSAGIPSVMAMTSGMSQSTASMMASAAKGGGTKMMEVLAPVASLASATVLYSFWPSQSLPALPGETPATIWVPYSWHCCAWKLPARPVP